MTQDYKNEIVKALAEGHTVKWIADKILAKPYKTVESHVGLLKKEHGCVNATHLVATYLRLKLIK